MREKAKNEKEPLVSPSRPASPTAHLQPPPGPPQRVSAPQVLSPLPPPPPPPQPPRLRFIEAFSFLSLVTPHPTLPLYRTRPPSALSFSSRWSAPSRTGDGDGDGNENRNRDKDGG
ncbi:hypothetical protein V9T40_000196 [Parthenolecanium corni]|uniref:Uncharacterized protein n=1 Tax=Parthenolecanium corni TaxID=536013 RepID=A0AAN9Y087_9HEMI